MTKNVGTLIRPSVHFETLGSLPPERRWWMVYYSDVGCDAACEKALNHFEMIRQSLVEDSPRLGMILITQKQIHTVPFKGVYELEYVGALPEGLPSHNGRAIWLVDPLGNIILDYDPVVLDNRLLLDLRHLLKVSRIG